MSYETILRNIYYDQKHPASYSSANKLYEAANKVDNSIKLSNVKNWLAGEFTYTLHKLLRKRFIRNPIIVETIDEQWEADLVDMQEFASRNNGVKYILTVIDVLSKYAWVVTVKNKTAASIVNAFKEIIKKGRKPFNIRTDQGKEFVNSNFKTFTKNEGINHFTSKSKDIKCAVVERFNRTLKSRMFKYFTAKGTRKYVNVLNDLVVAYNSAYHRSIKMRPIDVNSNNRAIVFKNLYKVSSLRDLIKTKIKSNIPSESLVRKRYELKPFDKSYYPNWTDETFTVKTQFKGSNKPMYKLSDNSKQRYYPEQI